MTNEEYDEVCDLGHWGCQKEDHYEPVILPKDPEALNPQNQ